MEYLAFMAAIPHIHFDYLEETLKEYNIGTYIIAAETCDAHAETNGQHFHFLVQMSQQDYHKYCKRVYKDTHQLRGRPVSGKPRQYGKLTQIHNLEKLKCYTVKDKNIRSNMEQKELDVYLEKSFTRDEKNKFIDDLFKKLNEVKLQNWTTVRYGIRDDIDYNASAGNYRVICKEMIIFYIEQDKQTPSPAAIKRNVIDWVRQLAIPVEDKADLLFCLSDIRNPFLK
jgi:hypothetical protein